MLMEKQCKVLFIGIGLVSVFLLVLFFFIFEAVVVVKRLFKRLVSREPMLSEP